LLDEERAQKSTLSKTIARAKRFKSALKAGCPVPLEDHALLDFFSDIRAFIVEENHQN
jgi:TPP-dependent indolepyruvate ferredoxin oxidoreductase alpha subunit